MLEALVQRHEERERKRWIQIGVLAASIINSGFCRPEKPVKVMDFVPGEKPKDTDMSMMTAEQAAAHMMNTFSKRTFSR